MKEEILKELAKVADHLDTLGLNVTASRIDNVIKKVACDEKKHEKMLKLVEDLKESIEE